MSYQLMSKNGEREHHFWPTPKDLIDPVVAMTGSEAIWEPCCGDGRIAEAYRTKGNPVYATDIADHGYAGLNETKDFYAYSSLPDFFETHSHVVLVTNPPHSRAHATAFVRHALELASGTDKRVDVFLLMRHQWDSAKVRIDLQERLDAKVTMCWRPRWIEDTKTSPMHSYAWYYWENGGQGTCQNIYLANDWNKGTEK